MPSAVARLGNRLSLQSFGIDYPAVITGYNEMAPPCTAREGNREDRKGGRAGTNVLNTPRNNCIYTSTYKMKETKICKRNGSENLQDEGKIKIHARKYKIRIIEDANLTI